MDPIPSSYESFFADIHEIRTPLREGVIFVPETYTQRSIFTFGEGLRIRWQDVRRIVASVNVTNYDNPTSSREIHAFGSIPLYDVPDANYTLPTGSGSSAGPYEFYLDREDHPQHWSNGDFEGGDEPPEGWELPEVESSPNQYLGAYNGVWFYYTPEFNISDSTLNDVLDVGRFFISYLSSYMLYDFEASFKVYYKPSRPMAQPSTGVLMV